MLTIQFVPYSEISDLSQAKKISRLLNFVKDEKIVLLEGKLPTGDEKELIKETMESIDERFKGIEIAVVGPEQQDPGFVAKLKLLMASALLGSRVGFTVIGPASIIKEIKQDPNKMQLFLVDAERAKRKKKI